MADNLLQPARITLTRLNLRHQGREFEMTRSAIGGGWFYPSALDIPWYGRWMIVISAGENWGCFLVTV